MTPDRKVVTDKDRSALGILQHWVSLAELMKPTRSSPRKNDTDSGKARKQSFPEDTAEALRWTCNSLMALTTYLLATREPWRHDWVALGFFQQDDIERHFWPFSEECWL